MAEPAQLTKIYLIKFFKNGFEVAEATKAEAKAAKCHVLMLSQLLSSFEP